MSNTLIIIGGGLAAFTLVREIRKLSQDFPITLMTRDKGEYYSKPQLSTALTYRKSPEQLVLISREKFATQFNVIIIPDTEVTSLDALSFSRMVLATGAKPTTLLSSSGLKIHAVNSLDDYRHFRQALENQKHVTIIGAGLVGCEFANDLCNGGYEVTLIAPEKYPLARLVPETVGLALKNALAEKGVCWKLGEFFNPTETQGVVLSAIGIKPEITLAQSAGLKVNQGIVVNQYLQTSHPSIYALGDCMEYEGRLLPYIAPLTLGARALAKTLLGTPTPVIYPPMPIYIKTPAYPIVVLPPHTSEGEWHIEQHDTAVRALFYHQHTLKGFALGGTFTVEAIDWVKKITADYL